MAARKGDVLVMQSGKGKAEVHEVASDEEVYKILSNKAPDIAARLRDVNARIAAIQKEVVSDPDEAVDYFMLQAAQARADEVLNLDLQDLADDERIKRIDAYHRYTTIGSALLYQDAGFHGSSKFFTTTWPNMSWWPYRFNDRASSAKVWGGNMLFEHSWYRGRRLYLIGLPFAQFEDFVPLGFNDIASSFVSIS